ncbi:efflux RND transporter periplasmic adaptor subunit [Oxalobacter vibrioformis]|uniref:Efflux RND transporter periplasmic adaptor subunit n=1 Tax=Oxalobacter vibrioformis TaxID=933080 RepID=A0A9E9LY78_9BURK|nr:efflux RND transporter periplasmic adaptor subunit [Oxalobacter vibrioformis]WAW09609.1 efflux RND transporter periplasmic adaptor subunit [Oxalobacter vibrioformis]
MSNRRKTGILALVAGLLLGAGTLWYVFYGEGRIQAAVPPEATRSIQRVTIIHPASLARTAPLIYNIRVEPIEQASVFARANGFVEERLVDIGDDVKAGQLLARLSSPELEEGIKQVKADINRQKAIVNLAKKMLARAEALIDIGAVSKTEYDERDAENQVAIATLATLRAKREQLENEYAYTRITAPFDGRITVRNIDKGDRISSSDTTALFRIVRDDTLRIIVDVPQTQIYAIDATGEATLTLPEMPDKAFALTYDRTSHEVDPSLGTMRMEYLLDNREHRLPAGIAGEIRIAPAKDSTTLTVPDNTIRTHDGKTAVMVLDEQNRAVLKNIVTGRYTSTVVEVASGLSATDRVILNPNALIKPGDTVDVGKNETPPEKP